MESIKTKVVHSSSKPAWNVIGAQMGNKFKMARVPYVVAGDETFDALGKNEALEHAQFISWCFNNADKISEACGGPSGQT